MYYLQSRYYDPEVGRFINADTYASTGQGFIGCNMFAYCSNNPVNYYDPAGTLWKGLSNLLNEIWEGIKACFGGEVSTVATVDYGEKIIPEPSPIVVKAGTRTSKTITQKGDSSKPYSVYAEINSSSPVKSSVVGVKKIITI